MRAVPLICDKLPDFIIISGNKVKIVTDFRHWIAVLQVFEERLSIIEKAKIIRFLVCPSLVFPTEDGFDAQNIDSADFFAEFFREITAFALRKASADIGGSYSGKNAVKAFDFSSDAELIFSSFFSSYGIDLSEAELHWWKFSALLASLPSDSILMKVIGIRKADLSSIKDDEYRKKLRRAKSALRLR